MTTPEIPRPHKDLLGAQVGVLGTIGASGRPQLSATWFLAEGDTVKISLNTARQKVKNLQADPKVSFIILGRPRRTSTSSCAATRRSPRIHDYEFADKVGAKYGADLRDQDQPGRPGWS